MNKKIKKVPLSDYSLNVKSNLSIDVQQDNSPFIRSKGHTMSVVTMTQDAPHNGEMHPDGDEAIYVISGCLEVTLELEQKQLVEVRAGEAIIIPQGVWHKVHIVQAAQIVSLAPGPGFEYRD